MISRRSRRFYLAKSIKCSFPAQAALTSPEALALQQRIMYRLLAAAAAIATVNAQSARVVTTVDNSGDTWCNGVKLGTGNGEHPTSLLRPTARSGAVPCRWGASAGLARVHHPQRAPFAALGHIH